ncbi:hypothetical protein AQPE_3114 [Aquipluma nitroreducens]|uniref:Uncharacterized protein n=1 Tax=Aquipluma nitroreducens TaxID=2010828 RepID=A0A5K7SBI8_9BACT|nr:hypothetical protein AQPE_3114 [Aquipluma nitroreducens]
MNLIDSIQDVILRMYFIRNLNAKSPENKDGFPGIFMVRSIADLFEMNY